MPSARYLQQYAWYIDPANVSGTANDNNVGDQLGAPLRTFREFTRRVGNRILVPAASLFSIIYLSDGPQTDPVDLEVSLGDDTASFELRANINADGSTSIAAYTPADPATNVLPDVQLAAPIFSSADEETRVIYNSNSDGWAPVAVSLTDPNRLMMENFVSADGTVSTVAQGDVIRRVPPKSIWIAKFKQLASANSINLIDGQKRVRLIGFKLDRMTEVENVSLVGCLLNDAQNFKNCYVNACKTAYANATRSDGYNHWIGCFLDGRNGKITVLGQGDLIAANARTLLRGDRITCQLSSAVTIFNSMSDGCGLIVGRGSVCIFGQNFALFGQEIVAALRDGAVMRRPTLNWDNSGSGDPVISWPNTAAAVYDAATYVPGPATPPGGTNWAAYNAGSASWIGQLTGARLTAA